MLEALKEVAHDLDTCANESFNNTISWLAPKNKVYSGTKSLANCLNICVGVVSIGIEKYYVRLLERLGIEVTPGIRHYLKTKSTNRDKRIAKTKTVAFKKKRKASEYNRAKKEMAEAKKARAKRESSGSVYEPGIGMMGGYVVDDARPAAKKKKAPKASKPNKDGKQPVCSKCKQVGHWRPTNKLCPFYMPRNSKSKEATVDTRKGDNQEGSVEPEIPPPPATAVHQLPVALPPPAAAVEPLANPPVEGSEVVGS